MLWIGVGFGYAAVAAVFTPLTWPAMLATVPPLAVAGWVGLRRPERPGGPRIGLRRILPWLAVLVVGTAWELIALLRSPRDDYPTISSIVSPLAGPHWWFRFVGYLVWFAAGVALVRR
ncbi:MAG TPA: hypothetical protein VIU11_15295 [Nakamurella sp.]